MSNQNRSASVSSGSGVSMFDRACAPSSQSIPEASSSACVNSEPQRQSMPEAPPLYSDPNKASGLDTPYYLLSPADLEKAAGKDPNAKFIFALALLNGYQGCPIQVGRGKQMILDLAKEAPHTAGGLCAQGKIDEHGWRENRIKDIKSALNEYNQAKEMGYVPAMYLYHSRDTIRFNINNLITIANKYNYGPAKSEIAHLYYYGNEEKRIEKNTNQAYQFASNAADVNHDLYSRMIAGYYLYRYGSRSDLAQAREYMTAAKEQVAGNWSFAEKRLGDSIENTKFDEMPFCLRGTLISWYGCCCVSSFYYPKIVPHRATLITTPIEEDDELDHSRCLIYCAKIILCPMISAFCLACGFCLPCLNEMSGFDDNKLPARYRAPASGSN